MDNEQKKLIVAGCALIVIGLTSLKSLKDRRAEVVNAAVLNQGREAWYEYMKNLEKIKDNLDEQLVTVKFWNIVTQEEM